MKAIFTTGFLHSYFGDFFSIAYNACALRSYRRLADMSSKHLLFVVY